MGYPSLEACLNDLEKIGQLVRVKEQVDPHLEMAAIHLKVFEAKGPAILFENVKGSSFRAVSNIFGTLERSEFIFRDSIQKVEQLIALKNNPIKAIKHPFKNLHLAFSAAKSFPKKNPLTSPVLYKEIKITDLPLIQHWPMDGGAFITLPQVYSEDLDNPGIMNANLGMYRIQLNGNEFEINKEVGLHYQLHRGIGVHQSKAQVKNIPLKVSIFVGGPPSHTVAAVMPLPEGMSEMTFAGVLGNRRFRYRYIDGFCISTDADFVITGEVYPNELKPEGPFGDHLGYYSLQHLFPVLKIHKVYARKNAIWPFTVVGRPPQEDTSFGQLIHRITGTAVQTEIPGLKELHAVDAAGVHPLLLAIGSERYTPYLPDKKPAELLTIANRMLGTGQLSLAKFLFITADDENKLSTYKVDEYIQFILERIHFERDVHFYTETTIDTLDYSGRSLNSGSKVVLAAYGTPVRTLTSSLPKKYKNANSIRNISMIMPGILSIEIGSFENYEKATKEVELLSDELERMIDFEEQEQIAMIIISDDTSFVSSSLKNFLWVTFTRSNPSHDIYGVGSFVKNKHWGCKGPLIIDARIKPHHAPPVITDIQTEKNIDKLFNKGGSLYGIVR